MTIHSNTEVYMYIIHLVVQKALYWQLPVEEGIKESPL